jgi:hypothetical protein
MKVSLFALLSAMAMMNCAAGDDENAATQNQPANDEEEEDNVGVTKQPLQSGTPSVVP